MGRNLIPCFHLWMLLAFSATSNAIESDISCLKSIKDSLEDPGNFLSSWDFSNTTDGFICRFAGVECWDAHESKVLNLRLSNLELGGPFPTGISNCTSITGLDLSRNYLSGHIPSNLDELVRFTTSLDLSHNNFSGPIPPSIANCTYMNVLRLDNNHLTGQIPPQLSDLQRIKEFNVANNCLSGPVPIFPDSTFSAESYANNIGLCGSPLSSCQDDDLFFAGFAVGFPLFTILSTLFMSFGLPRLHILIKKIKQHQILFAEETSNQERKVAAMEKFVRRLSLLEIERATKNFDNKNIIGYGNMGVMYKGVFTNGWPLPLAVKRLHKFESFEKEFQSEIQILGRLQHINLVQVLGFCFEMEKKFMVYKYMCNGSLHQWLHCRPEKTGLGWILRFKIAVGIARGLSWLHHNNVIQIAHLNITSKCILLDDDFEPKISNFGGAMILMNASDAPSSSCNFVAPDWGPYKKDVCKFGILLLELVTGREPSKWISSATDVKLDECLMGQGFDEEVFQMVRIAENCIQQRRDEAPTMLQVYKAIRTIAISRIQISLDPCMDVQNNNPDVWRHPYGQNISSQQIK